ncbi:MAG: LytTR family transcriptional regulator DNA-binding domain-containing protein [Saprospiraceae bacterium]|nr:LytTR family transcriptional regulator DNA-binding domain-containing protein [Saprospiraceae bacterium]
MFANFCRTAIYDRLFTRSTGNTIATRRFFRINRKVILHVSGIIKVSTHLNGRLAVATKFLEGDARIVSRERVNDFKSWMDDIVL